MKAMQDLGLTEREVKVYLALLDTGSTTVGPLVKKSGIPNSKIYETLEKLISRGLVTYVIRAGKKNFQPCKPKVLLNILEEKKRGLREALPKLELKYKLSARPQSAQVFEGIKGAKEALNNVLDELKRGETYSVFGVEEELQMPDFISFINKHHLKRYEKGVKVRIIFEKKSKKTVKTKYCVKGASIRYTKESTPTGVFVYKDKVMTFIWGERPTVFVIQSQQHADRYNEFFKAVWTKAKP